MSKEIVDWKSALVADAKKTQAAESTGGNFISLKGGRMTYQEQTVPNDQLECIVVANVHERTMYDRPYDQMTLAHQIALPKLQMQVT